MDVTYDDKDWNDLYILCEVITNIVRMTKGVAFACGNLSGSGEINMENIVLLEENVETF